MYSSTHKPERQAQAQETCPCCLYPISSTRPHDARCHGCGKQMHAHCWQWIGDRLGYCVLCARLANLLEGRRRG